MRRILLLEGCFAADELPMAAHLGLDLVVQGAEQVEALLAAELSRPLNVWLKSWTPACTAWASRRRPCATVPACGRGTGGRAEPAQPLRLRR